eukprot:CAMPEP_0201595712 /NCGR_PEP_ID=MMETSP0190_2-20130828/192623_1 /ASSEMBLY_ACC=CAM_ASM_000263 /TAXON_ID=37353 /ORGANISM="Rosalina sp." /LENGTH=664 /DNA_ID=CAMNT_0048055791 /DNA_START=1 /DNA_END=1992 /DNA_ORIENTATION=+
MTMIQQSVINDHPTNPRKRRREAIEGEDNIDNKRLRSSNTPQIAKRSELFPVGLVRSTTKNNTNSNLTNNKNKNNKPAQTPITVALQRGIDLIRNSSSPQPITPIKEEKRDQLNENNKKNKPNQYTLHRFFAVDESTTSRTRKRNYPQMINSDDEKDGNDHMDNKEPPKKRRRGDGNNNNNNNISNEIETTPILSQQPDELISSQETTNSSTSSSSTSSSSSSGSSSSSSSSSSAASDPRRPTPRPSVIDEIQEFPPQKASTPSYLIKILQKRKARYLKVYKQRLKRIYGQFNMKNLEKIDDWVSKYGQTYGHTQDKLHELYCKVCKKYDLQPCDKYEGQEAEPAPDETEKEQSKCKSVTPVSQIKPNPFETPDRNNSDENKSNDSNDNGIGWSLKHAITPSTDNLMNKSDGENAINVIDDNASTTSASTFGQNTPRSPTSITPRNSGHTTPRNDTSLPTIEEKKEQIKDSTSWNSIKTNFNFNTSGKFEFPPSNFTFGDTKNNDLKVNDTTTNNPVTQNNNNNNDTSSSQPFLFAIPAKIPTLPSNDNIQRNDNSSNNQRNKPPTFDFNNNSNNTSNNNNNMTSFKFESTSNHSNTWNNDSNMNSLSNNNLNNNNNNNEWSDSNNPFSSNNNQGGGNGFNNNKMQFPLTFTNNTNNNNTNNQW